MKTTSSETPLEKTIHSVVLDDGHSYAVIDLKDAPRAIEVSLSDGLVTFREGFGPQRLPVLGAPPPCSDHRNRQPTTA
jgi:hypothetical protein